MYQLTCQKYRLKFELYKNRVLYYQDKVDAIFFFGLIGLKDENNEPLKRDVIGKWTVENNHLPDVKFRKVYVDTLFAVDVSAEEQGKAAGIIAKEILIDGKDPSSFEFKSTKRGNVFINLARAEKLGLKPEDIPSSILMNSVVLDKFSWLEEVSVK